jgi:sec-independent protein translocase protein TatA
MGAGLLQPTHIIFVIAIALLVFGPKKLPEMGRSIGNGIREFKESMDGSGPSEPAVHHTEAHDQAPAAQPERNRVADLPPAATAPIHAPVEPRTTTAGGGTRVSR